MDRENPQNHNMSPLRKLIETYDLWICTLFKGMLARFYIVCKSKDQKIKICVVLNLIYTFKCEKHILGCVSSSILSLTLPGLMGEKAFMF